MDDKKKHLLAEIRGRGTTSTHTGRFESQRTHADLGDYGWLDDEDKPLLRTQFFKDTSRTIVNENSSPDIPFRYSINVYRGCEHGCIYCYARPTHEYLGMSAGLDFESKIFVKYVAPEQLREKLMSPRWEPECIVMSGVTDCYQPAERRFEITRRCLQVLNEFKNPAAIITKNALVVRDIDILREMAEDNLIAVCLSVTTLDADLARVLEPRTSAPAARLKAVETLAKAGVPVSINMAPIIPGLTDHEIPAVLKAAADAGAVGAGHTLLRLPYSVSDMFVEWLEAHRPNAKDKILSFIRENRGGKLNESNFGARMSGRGERAENVRKMFELFAKKYKLHGREKPLATGKFRRPGDQLSLL